MDATITGDDDVARCRWAHAHPEMLRYHDDEWGRALHGDRALFEKLSLEAFQAGLSWITILRKRVAFRDAFALFDIDAVAAFDDDDLERLMADDRIIRNRAKISATMANARAAQQVVAGSPGALDELIWGFAPEARSVAPTTAEAIPSSVPESAAASVALKRRGFSFVGPTTLYALMQYAGIVNDHVAGCHLAIGRAAA